MQLQFKMGKLIPLYYMSMYLEKETQIYIYLVNFILYLHGRTLKYWMSSE